MGESFMKRLILLGTLILCACSWFYESALAQSRFDPAIAEMISHVADSTMLQSIESLQSFGTRYTWASNRDSVAQWIRGRFLEAGFTDVVLDSFTCISVVAANVVATIHGSPETEIVVGAHYDSRSQTPLEYAPGADDNASGTSAVIELARVISALGYKPKSTMRFVAFSGHEQRLVGSSAYAQKAKDAGRHIRAMLNFDMVGYRNVGDTKVTLIWYQGGEAIDLGEDVISQYTALTPVLDTTEREKSDSYSFWQMEYPAVWYSEHQSNPYWHTTYDILSTIDGAYAAEIARSALALLLTLDKLTVVSPAAETVPNTLRLCQNYPNPFNPSTAIEYQLPIQSHVTLKVFNMLGQEAAVLVDEVQEAGYKSVQFNASSLPSGVYLYRLTAGDFVAAKKLIVLK
jgi:hypothetical protein